MSKLTPELTNYISAENYYAKDPGMGNTIRRNGFDGVTDGVKYISKKCLEECKFESSSYLLNVTGTVLNLIYNTAVDIRTNVAPSNWVVFIYNSYIYTRMVDNLSIENDDTSVGIRELFHEIALVKPNVTVRITPWNTKDEDLLYIIRLIVDKLVNDLTIYSKDATVI